MSEFDYDAPAELFLRSGPWRNARLTHRRFPSAALAIQFAVEGSGGNLPNGTLLEVDEERFDWEEIGRLYAAPGYPLKRKPAAKAAKS